MRFSVPSKNKLLLTKCYEREIISNLSKISSNAIHRRFIHFLYVIQLKYEKQSQKQSEPIPRIKKIIKHKKFVVFNKKFRTLLRKWKITIIKKTKIFL